MIVMREQPVAKVEAQEAEKIKEVAAVLFQIAGTSPADLCVETLPPRVLRSHPWDQMALLRDDLDLPLTEKS